MLRHWLNSLLALVLIASPAYGEGFAPGGGFNFEAYGQRASNDTVVLTRGTCVSDTADATTYSSAFTAVGTGATTATDTVIVVVAVLAEDALATFGINSMTINGITATEIVDEDGSGIVDAALYQLPIEISNAQTVAISVTASEAITGMVVCAWSFKNLRQLTALSSVQDDDTASGALVLTTGTTNTTGYVLGACLNSGAASTTTWAVITEREDTQNAEFDYSNADAAGTGSSMANTCDWSGTEDASGVAGSWR